VPTLLLLPKGDPLTMNALAKTAMVKKWIVHRYPDIPPPPVLLRDEELILYSGGAFALSQARILNIALLSPGDDWLTRLLPLYRRREDTPSYAVEFRCFVYEGRVIAMSPCRRQGKSCFENGQWHATETEQRAALSFAVRLLLDPDVPQPPAFVLDIGLCEGHGWAVVGAGPCYNASMYGCDPEQVLSALSRSCRPRSRLRPADMPWVAL
jgi:hypothetical protein